MVNISHCTSMVDEFRALVEGLQCVWEMSYRKVMAKSDSKLVLCLINSDLVVEHPCYVNYWKYELLIMRDWIVRFTHIYREVNRDIDWLSKYALQFRAHFLNAPLKGLLGYVANDIRA